MMSRSADVSSGLFSSMRVYVYVHVKGSIPARFGEGDGRLEMDFVLDWWRHGPAQLCSV
jgi:hypothetical protein